jgi:hypothetical protein
MSLAFANGTFQAFLFLPIYVHALFDPLDIMWNDAMPDSDKKCDRMQAERALQGFEGPLIEYDFDDTSSQESSKTISKNSNYHSLPNFEA